MKEFKNDTADTLSRFGRDRRERVYSQSAERVERRPRREDDYEADRQGAARYGRYNDRNGADGGRKPQKRASFNPNFTHDNRPAGESDNRYGRSGGSYGDDRRGNSYGGNSYGESRGASKPRSGNRYGEGRGSYGGGERKYSQNRHQGKPSPRRYYDENGDIDGNRIDAGDPAYDFAPASRPASRGGDYGRDSRDSRGGYGGRQQQSRGGAKPYGKSPAGRYAADSERRTDYKGKPAGGPQRRRDDRPKPYPKYSPDKNTGAMRLNRFIAQSGVCSRREADDFITAGLVTVNGEVVTTLGSKVAPGDDVRFNGERIQGEHKVYLVLNKPKGYVTSLDDPHANKTVMELVKGACAERIYPVGRLDKNSVGLLLFTNDGDLTLKLTHPALEKKKVYQVTLDKPLTNADMQSIADGITLDDGEIHADEIAFAKEDKKEVGIEIHSGRNRIVRRIFEHLGYKVQKLDRVYYAGLTKKNLKRGAWRFLTDEEVRRLKTGQYE